MSLTDHFLQESLLFCTLILRSVFRDSVVFYGVYILVESTNKFGCTTTQEPVWVYRHTHTCQKNAHKTFTVHTHMHHPSLIQRPKHAFECKVKYTSICIAHFYAKRLKCAQTWITQFYLQITPCLPLLPSRRTSPPFGWYSFYRPTEGRRLSRSGWLVTYRNTVPPPGVESGRGHPSQY